MRRPLVVGNWKMNSSRGQARELVRGIVDHIGDGAAEIAVCPPFVHLSLVAELLMDSPVELGAQSVCGESEGAFTGEVSAAMLAELGVRYVIVGHSERRTLFGENNQQMLPKLQRVLENGMTPIYCVGECLDQRKDGETLGVIAEQLSPVAALADAADLVVAYEPVWAIGTGLAATLDQVQEVHGFIRQQLGERGTGTRLLYGGSVNADNAQALFASEDVDGGLIGGASLKAEEFIRICHAADHN